MTGTDSSFKIKIRNKEAQIVCDKNIKGDLQQKRDKYKTVLLSRTDTVAADLVEQCHFKESVLINVT